MTHPPSLQSPSSLLSLLSLPLLALAIPLLAETPLPGSAPDSTSTSPNLTSLFEILETSEGGFTGLSFAEVVEAGTGHQVRRIDRSKEAENLAIIATVIGKAVSEINRGHHALQASSRINEASGPIEDEILRQFASHPEWQATFAHTSDGKIQRAGYPDLRLQSPDGLVYFLDPKLTTPDNRTSSFRTFYYEPRRTSGKINESAAHLLVGLFHNGHVGPELRLLNWELIDLADLQVRLKAEFQASNRELYHPAAILHSAEPASPEQAPAR